MVRLRQMTNFFLKFGLILNIAVLIRLLPEDYFHLQSSSDCGKNGTEWSKIDFLSPPILTNPQYESMRFNEFLAHSQYNCPILTSFANNTKNQAFSLSHKICLPPASLGLEASNSTKFFSILSFGDDLQFEKNFLEKYPPAMGIIFTPFAELVRFKYENVAIYAQDRMKEDFRKVILQKFQESGKFDILKLDNYDGSKKLLLLEIIKDFGEMKLLENVKQILLTIRFSGMDRELIHEWYKLLHRLFYEENFALFSAMQSGKCGKTVERCQYKISLARFNKASNVFAPIVGFGTPDEEFHRWFQYLMKSSDNFHRIEHPRENGREKINLGSMHQLEIRGNSAWKILRTWSENCVILAFLMPEIDQLEGVNFLSPELRNCQLNIYDPSLSDRFSKDRVAYFNYSLSGKQEFVPGLGGKEWELRDLDSIFDSFSRIDALLLDLKGMEWEVFPALLNSASLRKIRQIAFRFHLWYGEEYENEQQKFSWCLRLEASGFRKFPAKFLRYQGQDGHRSVVEVVFAQ